MKNRDITQLFSRYLEKKASPEEVKLLLDYFRMEKESGLLVELILQEMECPPVETNIIDIKESEVYNRVKEALGARIDSEQRPLIIPFYRKPMFYIAASVAAVLLIGISLFLWDNSKLPEPVTAYASYGKQTEVDLPDKTKVWLNAGTTLIYPNKFKGHERDVTLKNGEAYFEVVHDTKKPFVVSAGDAKVTVLGTSFEVSSLDKEKQIKVSVTTGKVGVQLISTKQPATFLVAGQTAIISKTSQVIRLASAPVTDMAVWRQQRLIFDDQPLADVMQRLERKYNVEIKIENTRLLSEKITMRLNNQPLTDVLTAISFANHFNYEIINDQLIIVK